MMTTELVLLLGIFAFVLLGAFLGPSGPKSIFLQGGPHLAARIEKQLSTGAGFRATTNKTLNEFKQPPAAAPEAGF